MDNMPKIAAFSLRVMRPETSAFLANQESIFKDRVKQRLGPSLDDGQFDNVYAAMAREIDCASNTKPIILNDLGNNFVLNLATNDWYAAECTRKTGLRQAFLAIDAFYAVQDSEIDEMCDVGIVDFVVGKVEDLVNALQKTDIVVTEMFEDLTRQAMSTPIPVRSMYSMQRTVFEKVLALEFEARMQNIELDRPCPKPDVSNQRNIVVSPRSTRPTTTTTTSIPSSNPTPRPTTSRASTSAPTPAITTPRPVTTATSTMTTTASSRPTTPSTTSTTTTTPGVNQFLLNVFNRRSG